MRLGRRQFLQGAAAGLVTSAASTLPRNGWPAAKEQLIVVEGRDLQRMLVRGLEALPELQTAVRGKNILLKPNATGFQPYPVTTDPVMLRLLIRELKRRGAAQITLCDAPSYAGITAWRVFSKLGYFELGQQEDIRVLCCDPVRGSQHMLVSRREWKRNSVLLTNRFVQNADLVINLAIPKRHHVADFSCALKNSFGCTADTFRTLAHSREQDSFFDESLVEFADAVRPELTIADARKVLAKSGPGFTPGRSEIKNADLILISGDMVAVDSFCARLMEQLDNTFTMDQRIRGQLQYARALGLGDPEQVTPVRLSS